MKVKKSGNGNGAGRPIGVTLSSDPKERPVGTIIKMSDEQRTALASLNDEVARLKVQLGELTFAADDIARRRTATIELLRNKAEELKATAGQVVESFGIPTNDPASGIWNVDVIGGKIERAS